MGATLAMPACCKPKTPAGRTNDEQAMKII
jgi:hypothetical protein